MVFVVSSKNFGIVPPCPLFGVVLYLHINPYGEWKYYDVLGVWITIAPSSGVEDELCHEE